eukprot:CAMPEP_0202903772 /NCGR_PEP_ID=MMETSP1392-20130828/26225_1 /ASSEMBLY_ACC=CAM_ASM_000868 /TAXON_ID=225041 /ORGANISM="Chlamydomonas chlamydogama, Strain SAG 11-48b" /LENGTH=367 /DNA_ID=CAMNT_0049591101 /DNA_START=121 /DNA_END=1224 /DNA_ORIENTATION=-
MGTSVRDVPAAVTIIVLTVLLHCASAIRDLDDGERLIGWQGDTYKPKKPPSKETWVELISWKPRAFIFHNFLTDEEAEHIIQLSWPQMQRSTVVGENGSSVLDDYRTSYGTFLNRYQTPVIARIQDRVAVFTRAPVVHQEDMQVLRYGVGQYYHKHTDSLDNDTPRMATLLLYLSDPVEGGETSFPDGSQWANPEMERVYGSKLSDCAKGHVAFRPRRGDGVLFWSIHPDGKTEDPHSMHEGCPVVRGAKWTTTFWVHNAPFRPEEFNGTHFRTSPGPYPDPGLCHDTSRSCHEWVAAGECDKNPTYMRGSPDALQEGVCRASCKACEPCSEQDKAASAECYKRNRRAANHLVFNPQETQYRRPLDA